MEITQPTRTGGRLKSPPEGPCSPEPDQADGCQTAPEPPKPSRSIDQTPPDLHGGIYFCQVKGVTRRAGGDPLGVPGMKLFAVGDRVQLVPDPRNRIDPKALLVRRMSGEPIGFVTGRQAAPFIGKLSLLTAILQAWEKDEWNNDVLILRVEEPPAPPSFRPVPPAPPAPQAPSPQAVPLTRAQALQKAVISLPMHKILLGSLLITCAGVSVVIHSVWPATAAVGAVLMSKVALSTRT